MDLMLVGRTPRLGIDKPHIASRGRLVFYRGILAEGNCRETAAAMARMDRNRLDTNSFEALPAKWWGQRTAREFTEIAGRPRFGREDWREVTR